MSDPIEYFIKETLIKKKILVIKNRKHEEKLYQLLIDNQLVKLIFLNPKEEKEFHFDYDNQVLIELVEVK